MNNNFTIPFYIVLILFFLSAAFAYYQYKQYGKEIEYLKNTNYLLKSNIENLEKLNNKHNEQFLKYSEKDNENNKKKDFDITQFDNPITGEKIKIDSEVEKPYKQQEEKMKIYKSSKEAHEATFNEFFGEVK